MEDYKEKYEQALENIKKIKAANKDNKELVDFIEYKYPELKESEDERIRKYVINIVNQWWDRLGDPSPDYPTQGEMLAWLEKQDEQTLTEKIEPKFKVGDWVIYEIGEYSATLQIKNIVNGTYEFTDNSTLNVVDENTLRLWTIQDAKDGDVLASSRSVFIFQTEYIAGTPTAYCGLKNNLFIKDSDGCWTNEKCYPATKEQRDLLFKKMKEAGYEWDDEKKELRKIEQCENYHCCGEVDDEAFQKTLQIWFDKGKCSGRDEVIFHPENFGLQKQCEQNIKMIQWKGDNLREVVEFTGKSPKFNEWFKTWDDYENYVHSHGNIFKLFCEDGSHYEVPEGAWIVKTPDGYNVASKAKYKQNIEQKPHFCHHEVDLSDCSEEYRKAYYDGWNNCNQQHAQLKEEQKPIWSGEDSCCYDDICEILINLIHSPKSNVNKDVVEKDLDWLKSFKKRVQPKQKQEWGEEDEMMFTLCASSVQTRYNDGLLTCNEYEQASLWLKSLKERYTWKPNKEQIKALEDAIEFLGCTKKVREDLKSLYEQLKKLREE